ncbi:hypothetical protein D3C84_977920 [compost metagenome]
MNMNRSFVTGVVLLIDGLDCALPGAFYYGFERIQCCFEVLDIDLLGLQHRRTLHQREGIAVVHRQQAAIQQIS